ncbi:MAG: PhzF family phenazine biosynthesis protein [Acidobacteriota bacterium]
MRITQVDAFTNVPFKGNPAAVCLLGEFPSDRWMQTLAAEMNLSETAFLVREEDRYRLRWFTPKLEVDLCGHATLASAHALWEAGDLAPAAPALFDTASGLLRAEKRGSWIEMDFPSEPPEPVEPPAEILQALGVAARFVGKNRFDYLIELETEAEVRGVEPDFNLLSAASERGVIVTSRSSCADYDVVSRFFAPAVGIDEDPVTGSAHCCLGPFWAAKLKSDDVVGYQASERGGFVRMKVRGDRTFLAGQAITVLRGELTEPASVPASY